MNNNETGFKLLKRYKGSKLQQFAAYMREFQEKFHGVEYPTEESMGQVLSDWVRNMLNPVYFYTPNWWKGEKYYIQMIVEKVDMVSVFMDVWEMVQKKDSRKGSKK